MKIMISVFLGVASLALADPPPAASLNEARFGAAGLAVGPYVYVCAGYGLDESLRSVERLDPETGSVTTLPVRVTDRWFMGAAVWRDKIVLAGGIRSSVNSMDRGRTDLVELLDPVRGSVSNLPPLPRARSLPALAVVGDKLYVIGGASLERDRTKRTGDVSIYDFTLGTWSEGPPMPTPRECAVAVVGTRIYALGGYDGSNSLDVVEVFDTEKGAWESRPKLPAPQSAHRAVADGENVYLFGDYQTLVQVAAGNPETGNWRLLELPYLPARHSVADRVGDRFVVAGGNLTSSADSTLSTVQLFTRSQLENAPARAEPPAPASFTVPAPERPGELLLQQARARLTSLTNVALRGTWTMSYTARGEEHQLHAPYVLKTRAPDRVYLELGPTRLWFDGTTLTMADAVAGVFMQTNRPPPLSEALRIHAGGILYALPYGHQMLLDPSATPFIRSMRWKPGADTNWQGRPAWTLISPGLISGSGLVKPRYEIVIDPDSGITVAATSAPNASPRSTDECRTAEQELVETFRDHLVLDEVDTKTRWPDETFRAALDPTWISNPHATYHGLRKLRPDHAVSWLTTRRENQGKRWGPPERPAGWVPLWSTRICADEPINEYDRFALNRIPPRCVVIQEKTNLVVRRLSDGREELRIPWRDSDPDHSYGMPMLTWVLGSQPDEDRVVLLDRRGQTNQLTLVDRQGQVRQVIKGEEAVTDRLTSLPAGGVRREMLALVRGPVLRLVDPVEWHVRHVMSLSNERLEITDRDGDRLPEFTFLGRDISCYEWPPPE